MTGNDFQSSWLKAYRAAFLESDEHDLLDRIGLADKASHERVRELRCWGMVEHHSVDPRSSTLWREKFEAAMREPDKHKLGPLITEAEDAIFTRLQELDGKPDPERDSIAAAIPQLRKLR